MKYLYKIIPILLFWGISLTGISSVQASDTVMDTAVIFRFHPGEDMFTRTANLAHAYHNNKVTLHIPAKVVVEPQPAKEEVKRGKTVPQDVTVTPNNNPAAEEKPVSTMEQQPAPIPEQPLAEPEQPYRFAVRTNVLYDALLFPTLGVGWQNLYVECRRHHVRSRQ